jgi:hypothetical protein
MRKKNNIQELVDKKLNLIKGDIPKKGLTKFNSTTKQADNEMGAPPSYYTGYFRFGRAYPMLDVNSENEKNYREIQDESDMDVNKVKVKTEKVKKEIKVKNKKIDKLIEKFLGEDKVTEDVYAKSEIDSDILPKSDISLINKTDELQKESPAVVYKTKELIEAIKSEGVQEPKLKMAIVYEIIKALDFTNISRRDKNMLANKLMAINNNGEIIENKIKLNKNGK